MCEVSGGPEDSQSTAFFLPVALSPVKPWSYSLSSKEVGTHVRLGSCEHKSNISTAVPRIVPCAQKLSMGPCRLLCGENLSFYFHKLGVTSGCSTKTLTLF